MVVDVLPAHFNIMFIDYTTTTFNHRNKYLEMEAINTFPQFRRLPAEIQNMIWEMAAGSGPMVHLLPCQQQGRRIPASSAMEVEEWWEKLHRKSLERPQAAGASLLSVCFAARRVASRICRLLSTSRKPEWALTYYYRGPNCKNRKRGLGTSSWGRSTLEVEEH